MNRRFFLRGAGGALLAAPSLTSFREPAARAAAESPRRSVIFHTPAGCLTNRWFPKVEHGALDAEALAGTTLEPLAPYVAKLLFPRGLRAINAYGRPQTINAHQQAMGSKLTCSLLSETGEHYPSSHSLDHEIARQLNPNGADPLVLAIGNTGPEVLNTLSYSALGTPFPAATRPSEVFDGLSDVVSGASPTYRRRRGQTIIDAVREDLTTYQRLSMSSADRQRVDAWLDLLRESELACDASAVALDEDALAATADTSIANAFTADVVVMLKLIALHLLCDLNRSIVLSFPSYVTFDWDGIQHAHDHDSLAHRNGTGSAGGTCVPGVLAMLREIDAWYATKFSELVSLLDRLPEGENTLLDNTASVWLQEFSDGNAQNLNNAPIVIAGSAGGRLKQGAAVNVEGTPLGSGNSEGACNEGGDGVVTLDTGSTTGNVPINKLYVTLLNALGCTAPGGGPIESFGTHDSESAEPGIHDPGELAQLKA